jgi:L-threonylcarbamoyladenylate synthase
MEILTPLQIDEVAALLNAGHVVVIPTDTVYGVAAKFEIPTAVRQLFAIKQRPSTVPLPIFVNDGEGVFNVGGRETATASTLAHAFWPGPLTLIVPALASSAERIGSGDGTIGFRRPNDELVEYLVARCGPLAVTSANEHGAPPCTSVAEVQAAFEGNDLVMAVLDGGERNGTVSTVVICDDNGYRIVREGAILSDQLAAAFRG